MDSSTISRYYIDNITNVSRQNKFTDINRYNGSTGLYSEDILSIYIVRKGLPILLVLSIILSIGGNLFWIIFMCRSSRASKSSNVILILNLAVCDFIKSTVVAPVRVTEFYLSKYQYNQCSSTDCCRFLNFFTLYLALVGFHSVVAISLERLVLICFPLYARIWLRRKVVLTAIIFIWLSSLVVSLPFTLLYSNTVKITFSYGTVVHVCSLNFFYSNEGTGAQFYVIIVTLLYYVLPVLIVSIAYVKVVACLNKTINNFKSNTMRGPDISLKFHELKITGETSSINLSPLSESPKYKEKNIQKVKNCNVQRHSSKLSTGSTLKTVDRRRTLARMMIAVTFCFIIFHGPLFFMHLYFSLGYKIERNMMFTLVLLKLLPNISSMINPLVYSTGWKVFKKC
ncbi:hypothetical protein HELRODRAFT_167615 [Helobdella robusta]|uniref:G-protein coupled receptors family 1 profile domain-containing protein n=1 Tax=Helobdella robusta TaxID=6412 RepID=T1EZK4_HELRO|nr:hypothetical protein HELRODRAFT_167615 [Helobdella robusta]ESO11084.1 hypothetical protein HELRODRAFT_167615 [Helobdella robusta]